MIDDADLEERLLSYIIDQQRKVMFVITSVFEDIDNACSSILLWGSGDDEPDELLERSIARLRSLAAQGRIEAFGDRAKPRYSEVRLPAK